MSLFGSIILFHGLISITRVARFLDWEKCSLIETFIKWIVHKSNYFKIDKFRVPCVVKTIEGISIVELVSNKHETRQVN